MDGGRRRQDSQRLPQVEEAERTERTEGGQPDLTRPAGEGVHQMSVSFMQGQCRALESWISGSGYRSRRMCGRIRSWCKSSNCRLVLQAPPSKSPLQPYPRCVGSPSTTKLLDQGLMEITRICLLCLHSSKWLYSSRWLQG